VTPSNLSTAPPFAFLEPLSPSTVLQRNTKLHSGRNWKAC
jgi:hypothetical protein